MISVYTQIQTISKIKQDFPPFSAWQVRAQALSLNEDESILFEFMVNHLKFADEQYICPRESGIYETLDDLNHLKHKDTMSN